MRDHFFVLCLSLAVVAGCQSQTEVATPNRAEEDASTATQPNEKSTESTTADLKVETALKSEAPKLEDSPDQVCRVFLKMLQQGETNSATRLCTRKAQVLTMKFGLPLAFPGEPDASYSVGETKFATSKEELAQVVCEFGNEQDEEEAVEIGWMLKRSPKGWRISGMLLPTGGDKPMDFISFETVEDLNRIKAMIYGDSPSDNLQVSALPTADEPILIR